MGFASNVLIILLGAFLARGQAISDELSKIKLCLLDFSRGHLMINCSPKIKQEESSYFLGTLGKRTESTSGKLFNPWIGKRKKRSLALRQGVDSDFNYLDSFKCEDLDNLLANFCKKLPETYLPDLKLLDWPTTYEAWLDKKVYTQEELAMQDFITDSDWSTFRRAIKRNGSSGAGNKNSSSWERLQNYFDWDRLKRAETLKK